MNKTAFAGSFEKAGLNPRDVQFDIAIAKYLNSGGTIEGADARLRLAAETLSQSAPLATAGSSGQIRTGSQERDRGDHAIEVSKDQLRIVAPVREPSAGQRRAAANVRNVVSITVLDTFTIRDGRAIGDVRMGEVDRLRAANAMEASIFRQIQKYAVADHDMRIRDVIKPEEFQRIQQLASEVADAT